MEVSLFNNELIQRPWYFKYGLRYPVPAKEMPAMDDATRERFIDQMMFVPENYKEQLKKKEYKTILSIGGLPQPWNGPEGNEIFSNLNCPVQSCKITTKAEERSKADLVIFIQEYQATNDKMPANQTTALLHVQPIRGTPQQKPEHISKLANYLF